MMPRNPGAWGADRWAAEGMVAVVYIHMARVFFTGAYRGTRAVNWVVGVVLFLSTLFLSFTGYLLPWDQLAFWAITVGTSIAKQAPLVGPTIQFILLGGHEIGPQTFILGGRSMGGRAASMLAAEEFPCDGLLLLAYPLHPAGKPEELRDAHLARIKVPVLCLNGTRDALCRRDLMEGVGARLTASWTMHWLEGADHSFHVLKSSGRTDGEVLSEIAETCAAWASGLRRSI